MPIYEFRCQDCDEITSVLWRGDTRMEDIHCKYCDEQHLQKIVSRISVHRNMASKLDNLDPKYDNMVNQAVKNTPEADPNRHLSKMKPFVGSKPLTEK